MVASRGMIACLALALGLAGCGGDDKGETGSKAGGTATETAPTVTTPDGKPDAMAIERCLKDAGLTAAYTDLGIGSTQNERVVIELDGVGNGAEVLVFKSAADVKEDEGITEALYDDLQTYGETVVLGFSPPAGPDSEGADKIEPCMPG